jgi:cytochrome oxidase Cu insertion factor (SCO1/SenC/PrrC family)
VELVMNRRRRLRSVVMVPLLVVAGLGVVPVCVFFAIHLGLSPGASTAATGRPGAAPSLGGPSAHVGSSRTLDGLVGDAVWTRNTRPAPRLTLAANSRPFSLAAQRGRVLLVTFLDSRCRTICPVEGSWLGAIERRLSPRQRPLLVIISINPSGDTRASILRAVSQWRIMQPWVWLTGSRARLKAAWRAFGVYVGDSSHDSLLYLIDRRGDERVGMLFPFSPPVLAADLRRLASEPGPA